MMTSPTSEFQIRVAESDDAVVLKLSGELDLRGAPELSRAADAALRSHTRVRVDLTELRFIDSSGLAALLHAHEAAETARRRLTLAGPTKQVRDLLDLTGMLDRLDVSD